MASFLRSKQAGVQRDLSAGLDSSLFAIDEVLQSFLIACGLLTDFCIGRTLWNQLPSQCSSIRPNPIFACCGNERYKIWEWADICIWAKARQYNFQTSQEGICEDTANLRRQAGLRGYKE